MFLFLVVELLHTSVPHWCVTLAISFSRVNRNLKGLNGQRFLIRSAQNVSPQGLMRNKVSPLQIVMLPT